MGFKEEEVEGKFAPYMLPRSKFFTREEAYALAVDYYENKTPEAAHALVISYLPAVVKLAVRFSSYYGVPVRDLIQEGAVALLEAIRLFDPYRGTKLITFAYTRIVRDIREFIVHNRSVVKIGTTNTQKTLFFKVTALGAGIWGELSSEEQIQELADLVGITPQEVIDFAIRCNQSDLLLGTPISFDSEETYSDVIEDSIDGPDTITLEHTLASYRKVKVKEALSVLTERERFVIEKRFLEEEPWTLKAIGQHYGVTREYVRQVEGKTLRKLRSLLPEELSN